MTRLEAIQRAMMMPGGSIVRRSGSRRTFLGPDARLTNEIVKLRRALQAEHAARIAAEARLTRVLEEVASQVKAAHAARKAPVTRVIPATASRSLPAKAMEVDATPDGEDEDESD